MRGGLPSYLFDFCRLRYVGGFKVSLISLPFFAASICSKLAVAKGSPLIANGFPVTVSISIDGRDATQKSKSSSFSTRLNAKLTSLR